MLPFSILINTNKVIPKAKTTYVYKVTIFLQPSLPLSAVPIYLHYIHYMHRYPYNSVPTNPTLSTTRVA